MMGGCMEIKEIGHEKWIRLAEFEIVRARCAELEEKAKLPAGTIRINAEMLRESYNKHSVAGSFDCSLRDLEWELFGPKPPREAWAAVSTRTNTVLQWKKPGYAPTKDDMDHVGEKTEWVKFREVLE